MTTRYFHESRHRRRRRSLCWAAAALVAVLSVGGCGIKDPAGSDNDDTWSTIVDPATGQVFSCFTIWRSSGNSGGPAVWCHEVVRP